MPPWWRWLYWIDPLSYALYGIIGSQLSDVTNEYVEPLGGGTPVSVSDIHTHTHTHTHVLQSLLLHALHVCTCAYTVCMISESCVRDRTRDPRLVRPCACVCQGRLHLGGDLHVLYGFHVMCVSHRLLSSLPSSSTTRSHSLALQPPSYQASSSCSGLCSCTLSQRSTTTRDKHNKSVTASQGAPIVLYTQACCE